MGRPSDYIVFDKNNNISNIIIIILVIKVDHSMSESAQPGLADWLLEKKRKGGEQKEKRKPTYCSHFYIYF